MRQQYKVAKNPTDSKWYVVGNCGNGYNVPGKSEVHIRKVTVERII
jgi:uncharacterized protein YaiE (UPF0345 family)